MAEHNDPKHTVDALSRDLTELVSRVRHDPATRTATTFAAVITAVTLVALVATVIRAVFRRRGIIGKLLLLATAVATLNQLRESTRDTSSLSADGPPPPPVA